MPTYLRRRRNQWGRTVSYAIFFGVLIAVLFGSYSNQLGELFPSLIGAPPAAKVPAVVKLGPNGANTGAESKLPIVVKLGTDTAGPLDNLTTGSIGGSKLPTIVKPGADPATAPNGSRLPAVVKPGVNSFGPTDASLQRGRIEVIDGDTVRLDGRSYRLAGIDTPESGARAKCATEREKAEAATRRLREIVAGGGLRLERVSCNCPAGAEGTEQCNYGRLCGVLTSSGRDVGQTLIGEGLARSYNCGAWHCPKKQSWCT
jgi:endonuclease YncB( thermonuclease family)